MDPVTRFDGIVRQLNNLREPVTPAQLYHRFLEASLQSKGTHHQLLATAICTNPVPLTYDQMKVRFEKSALQHAPGAQHHLLLEMQLRSITSAPVAPLLLPRHTSTGAQARSTHSRENDLHLATILDTDVAFAAKKGILPKGVSFVPRWTSSFSGTNATSRSPRAVVRKKNKARHGFDSSRDTRGDPGRPPRSSSPHRKKLRWGDSREINFLEGAEINSFTFDEREPSSYVAMVDTPEDPEEPNAVPPPPSPPDESDSDMEEASVSSTDSSMPGLVTDSDSDDEPDGEEICRQIRIRRPPRNLPTMQAATRVSVDIIFSPLFHRRLSRLVATRQLKILSNPSRMSMCIHHHRFVNRATRRNFTPPMSPIPLQVIVPR
jgi:hypothetical protein